VRCIALKQLGHWCASVSHKEYFVYVKLADAAVLTFFSWMFEIAVFLLRKRGA
jgi:hypothetical protein